MSVIDELNHGKGYSIIDIEKLHNFELLRKSFINIINNKENVNTNIGIDEVRKKIARMNKAEVNKYMIQLLKFTDLSEILINCFPKLIESLCGKELFIQRRATIIMNVPGKNQAKQWPHYELMSGISPYTYVIWAPLHDLEENSGVYYIEQKESFEIMQKEQKMGLVNGPTVLNLMGNKKTEPLKFGQAIIFNPFIIHGNVSFDSNLARVAYNVRFQSCEKPLLQKNSDYLKYYKLS